MSGRASELRANAPTPERRMRRIFLPFRTDGYHIRRQAPIGPYLADIARRRAKVVIEIDGHTHGTRAEAAHDRRRDAFLHAKGSIVLRFSNEGVLGPPSGACDIVSSVPARRPGNRRFVLPGVSPLADTLPLVGRGGEGDG